MKLYPFGMDGTDEVFQLILNPNGDWNDLDAIIFSCYHRLQLILNPNRDWNNVMTEARLREFLFQLILNPTRDWNFGENPLLSLAINVPINLKLY